MESKNYPRLYQFLGAYFHEDWMCEFEISDDIVKSFLSDSSAESVLRVKLEINALLLLNLTETELRDFLLGEMSCCYCYWHDWSSGEAWLTHVLVLLGEEL
jgi:hypothetical protein